MKKGLVIIFLIVLTHLSAANLIDARQLIEYQQINSQEIILNFAIDEFHQETITKNGTVYTLISHPNAFSSAPAGYPDLPSFHYTVALPSQGELNLEILSSVKSEQNNLTIYPREITGESGETSFYIDEQFYYSAQSYPGTQANIGNPVILRDIRLATISINPFQYDAASQKLLITSEIGLRLTISDQGGDNCKIYDKPLSRSFQPIYSSYLLNYQDIMMRPEYQTPSLLFITAADDEVLAALQPLLDWKRQKGFDVHIATTAETGLTNTEIRAYIQNAYNNWVNPPEYVCLTGDANGDYSIPTFYNNPDNIYGEGDQSYGELEGDDHLLDVHLGRLSFESIQELQIIVAKILYYEKNPYIPDNNIWLEHALLIGDPSSMGYITIENSLSIKELMLAYPDNWESDENFYEIYTPNFPNQIDNALETGVSYMFYRGFIGVSGWNPGTQENDFMLPMVTLIGCSTGNFADDTISDPETLLRMGSVEVPRGAIGAIGQATCAQHTYLASGLTIGMVSGLLFDKVHSMGATLTSGKLLITQVYPGQNFVPEYLGLVSLIGDPSLDLWTKIPDSFSVQYPEQIGSGDNWLPVQVSDSSNEPISGAWVTLTAANPLDFSVFAFTDPSGMAILSLENIPEETCILTVSSPDFIPAQHYIAVESFELLAEVSESAFIETSGNGDNILNPGETFDLDISLTNYGSLPLNDVFIELSSSSIFIEIISPQLDYGNIPAGGTANPPDNFSFNIAPSVLGGMEAEFKLDITDSSGNEWTSWIYATISGASIYLSYFDFAETRRLNPGQTANLYLELINNGSMPAPATQAILTCTSPGILILNNQSAFNSIGVGGSANNMSDPFIVTASDYILPGAQINLKVNLSNASGFDCSVQFTALVGTPQEGYPCANDVYGYICLDDDDTDYEDCPYYDWIEISPYQGGPGTSVSLASQYWSGASTVIDLPADFNFKFYGQEYEQLTICSNGWIAPGYHATASYCNWPLPSPQGPSPIIAVFWDDLRIQGAYPGVFWYYDEINHWLIVEWFNATNLGSDSPQTFQVILYDYIHYPSQMGDSNIKMQYAEIDNANGLPNPEYHAHYATVGLENSESTSGLLYTYNNNYYSSNKPLENEMAIFFTTNRNHYDLPFLRIEQVNISAGDDDYIEAEENIELEIVLNNSGNFTAHNVYLELSSSDDYIHITQPSLFLDSIAVHQNLILTEPFIFFCDSSVPDFHHFELNIHLMCDEASFDRIVSLTAYQPNTFQLDQDSLYFEMDILNSDSYQALLTNIGDDPVNYYIITQEFYPETRDISGAYLYCDTNQFIGGETVDWVFNVINGAESTEWITDLWLEFPYEVMINYATNASGGSGGDLVWDGTTGSGLNSNWSGVTPSGLGVIRTGEMAELTANVTINEQTAGDLVLNWEIAGDNYGAEPHTTSGSHTIHSLHQWLNVQPSSGCLLPGETQFLDLEVTTFNVTPGTYRAQIQISSDSWDFKNIDVTLRVTSNDETPDQIPQTTALTGNYPNPFNPSTSIKFQLAEPGFTTLNVFNIKGQLVNSLISEQLSAGKHEINWDGCDNRSRPLGSGIYFYSLAVDGNKFSRKMLLLK
jgi:hypothetical protein